MGLLPSSFFEDKKLGTSDNLVHEDNLVSVCDFSMKEKTKARSPTVSINDLISSLYSQVEEKNAVNLSEKSHGYGFVSVKAASDSNIVNGEDDSWEFQGSTNTMTDPSIAAGGDEFDSAWQFQGPAQPVRDSTSRKGDNGSWKSEYYSVKNEVGKRYSFPLISIEHKDYQDVFHKLKTELYYIALNHHKTLKETYDVAVDSDEVAEVQKCDGEIQKLQNLLNSDVLISEVNLANLQPRFSGITELCKALQEPKFRAKKDWKLTVELLKHALLTLKILNLGSPEKQSNYISTWVCKAVKTVEWSREHYLVPLANLWANLISRDPPMLSGYRFPTVS
ncbi:unnamed protein product [Arabis nemorensis]|uniref:Synergin gamma C-terminal domain-containing protein n=1 Tax=Arabis nemorensis TaxID=586526 RepID=A0A565BAT5_9BRAS|nr:unnamed protein product [Arabis nemorensis]